MDQSNPQPCPNPSESKRALQQREAARRVDAFGEPWQHMPPAADPEICAEVERLCRHRRAAARQRIALAEVHAGTTLRVVDRNPVRTAMPAPRRATHRLLAAIKVGTIVGLISTALLAIL